MQWIGHILRHGVLLGLILEGMADGKNYRAAIFTTRPAGRMRPS